MTPWNENIFRVTGHLCGEFTGSRWSPRTKAMQWRGALMFSLICVWINGWVNNREAGDLRRHCAHYDVIVIPVRWTTRGKNINCNERNLVCINLVKTYPVPFLRWWFTVQWRTAYLNQCGLITNQILVDITWIKINILRPRQMVDIFQTTVSNAFFLSKMYDLRLQFHWLRQRLSQRQHPVFPVTTKLASWREILS